MEKMELGEARTIVAHVVAQKLRWEKQYDAGDIGMDTVLRALVALAQADNERISGRDEEIEALQATAKKVETKTNRQMGAAKSRETKLRNDLAAMGVERDGLVADVARLCDEHDLCVAELCALKDEIERDDSE